MWYERDRCRGPGSSTCRSGNRRRDWKTGGILSIHVHTSRWMRPWTGGIAGGRLGVRGKQGTRLTPDPRVRRPLPLLRASPPTSLPMTDDTFPMAGLKAGLTLLVLAVLFGFLLWDARRNRPS